MPILKIGFKFLFRYRSLAATGCALVSTLAGGAVYLEFVFTGSANLTRGTVGLALAGTGLT